MTKEKIKHNCRKWLVIYPESFDIVGSNWFIDLPKDRLKLKAYCSECGKEFWIEYKIQKIRIIVKSLKPA